MPRGVTRKYKVLGFIPKRVSAELAANNYEDHSPEPVNNYEPDLNTFELPQAVREKGEGRPTKKDRRDIEDFTNY